ncbi:MAG: cytochrome c biogenesis protein CcsA [Planctomycetota bacterium]|nr:cytochrome c biogenesis protein CcsA [Planctomycetota bacterium]
MSRFLLPLLLFVSLLTSVSSAQESSRTEPWGDEIVELFQTLPVQDNGRVKPMGTLAGLRLFMLNGKRTLKLPSGEKLGPTEWALDTIFHPEQAKDYACIRIENDAILTLVELDAKRKRDWYSYNELLPARTKISREAGRVFDKREAGEELNVVDKQIQKLDIDLRRFEGLMGMMEPLRIQLPTNATEPLRELFGEEPSVGSMALIEKKAEFNALRQAAVVNRDETYDAAIRVLDTISASFAKTRLSANLIPPPSEEHVQHLHELGFDWVDGEEWWGITETVSIGVQGTAPDQVEMLAALQGMVHAGADQAAFLTSLRSLHDKAETLATARGEYKHIEREISLYAADPFWRALYLFVFAFLLMLASFLGAKLEPLKWGGWAFTTIGLGLVVYGITMRCIIRERPPVVTLYDTILFVSSVMMVVALVSEALFRTRVALTMAALVGVIGMFVAGNYELREVASAGDTMASVVAVLDTNYYLAIHVTTIAMGYAGGLLAGFLGITWILGQLVGLGARHKAGFKALTRATYGVVAFSLVFSIFGTVMGGVWANDSWGRFWGWDPKENGALLICLWMLFVVHLRLGGYIRDRGLATMTTIGAGWVSFSWWHVNMLEIGLHSYGKIDGIFDKLITVYISLAILAGISVIDHFIKSGRGPAAH